MPVRSYEEIDSIASRMKGAGAPDADVRQYVALAMKEVGAKDPESSIPEDLSVFSFTEDIKKGKERAISEGREDIVDELSRREQEFAAIGIGEKFTLPSGEDVYKVDNSTYASKPIKISAEEAIKREIPLGVLSGGTALLGARAAGAPFVKPVAKTIASLAGAVAGGFGGEIGGRKAIGAVSPEALRELERAEADQPEATLLANVVGGGAPYQKLGSTAAKTIAQDLVPRAIGGGALAGIQAGTEYLPEGDAKEGALRRIMLASGAGFALNEPTRIGKKILGQAPVKPKLVDQLNAKGGEPIPVSTTKANEIALGKPPQEIAASMEARLGFLDKPPFPPGVRAAQAGDSVFQARALADELAADALRAEANAAPVRSIEAGLGIGARERSAKDAASVLDEGLAAREAIAEEAMIRNSTPDPVVQPAKDTLLAQQEMDLAKISSLFDPEIAAQQRRIRTMRKLIEKREKAESLAKKADKLEQSEIARAQKLQNQLLAARNDLSGFEPVSPKAPMEFAEGGDVDPMLLAIGRKQADDALAKANRLRELAAAEARGSKIIDDLAFESGRAEASLGSRPKTGASEAPQSALEPVLSPSEPVVAQKPAPVQDVPVKAKETPLEPPAKPAAEPTRVSVDDEDAIEQAVSKVDRDLNAKASELAEEIVSRGEPIRYEGVKTKFTEAEWISGTEMARQSALTNVEDTVREKTWTRTQGDAAAKNINKSFDDVLNEQATAAVKARAKEQAVSMRAAKPKVKGVSQAGKGGWITTPGKQTESPEFKAWFGKSKVVDEAGKPLVVAHGTSVPDNFGAFDTKVGQLGAHFSAVPEVPNMYSGVGNKARVYPVHLKIENPWRARDLGRWDSESVAHEWTRQWAEANGIQPRTKEFRDYESKILNEIWNDPDYPLTGSKKRETQAIQNFLKKRGYDGVSYLNRWEVLDKGEKAMSAVRSAEIANKHAHELMSDAEFKAEWPMASEAFIAFEPTQIKSARGNKGTYDSGMSDMSAFSSPTVMANVASPAVGGAVGFATGDTPEERIKRGLAGLAIGAGISGAATAATRPAVRKLIKEGFEEAANMRSIKDAAPKEDIVFPKPLPEGKLSPATREFNRAIERNARETKGRKPLSGEDIYKKLIEDSETNGTAPPTKEISEVIASAAPHYQPGLTDLAARFPTWEKWFPGSQPISKAIGLMARGAKVALGQVSANVRERLPEAAGMLEERAYRLADITNNWTNRGVKYDEIARKNLTPEEYQKFDIATQNGDVDGAMAVIKGNRAEVDLATAYREAITLREEVRQTMLDRGIEVGDVGEAFPRSVWDRKGLLKKLGVEATSAYDDMVRSAKEKRGRKLTDDEEVELMNNFLSRARGMGGRPGFLKGRKIEELDAEIYPFYEHGGVAMKRYLDRAAQYVLNQEFFGKTKPDFSETEEIGGSIGGAITRALNEKRINSDDLERLSTVIRRYFRFDNQMGGELARVANGIRNVQTFGMLADIGTAVMQFADIFNITYAYKAKGLPGYFRTGKDRLKLEDVNVFESHNVDLADLTRASMRSPKIVRAIRKSYELPLRHFLGAADALNKGGFINVANRYWSDMVNRPGRAAFQRMDKFYSEMYPERWPAMLADLRKPEFAEGKLTGNTRFFLRNELARWQPIDLAQRAEGYAGANPVVRLFYTLRSYAIAQQNIIRRDVYDELKKGNKWNAIGNMAMYAGLAGVGQQLIRAGIDAALGRELEDPAEYAIQGAMQLMLIPRYSIYRFKEEGPYVAGAEWLVPGANILTDIQRDAIAFLKYTQGHRDAKGYKTVPTLADLGKSLETSKYVPAIGREIYWMAGRGAQKTEKLRQQESKGKERPGTFDVLESMVFPPDLK